MKLDPEVTAYILNVVNTCKIVDIQSVVIEDGMVRGMNDDTTVVIFHDEDVIEQNHGAFGLTRLNELKARYDIASSCQNFSVEVIVKENEDFVRSIIMKGKGTKVDYRCGKPDQIKAPRQINDEMQAIVPLTEEAVNLLQKGASAMGSEFVSIISNDDGVSFELADVNNDVFKHTFADKAIAIDPESKIKFAHRYPIKTIIAMFKQNMSGTFAVGAKGMLQFPVNGLNLYLLPQV